MPKLLVYTDYKTHGNESSNIDNPCYVIYEYYFFGRVQLILQLIVSYNS